MPIDSIPALEPWDQATGMVDASDRVFGDVLSPKKKGVFRQAYLNVGNFGIESLACSKLTDLFMLIQRYDIDVMTMLEHGLNPYALKSLSAWNSRIAGHFERKVLHLAWN